MENRGKGYNLNIVKKVESKVVYNKREYSINCGLGKTAEALKVHLADIILLPNGGDLDYRFGKDELTLIREGVI